MPQGKPQVVLLLLFWGGGAGGPEYTGLLDSVRWSGVWYVSAVVSGVTVIRVVDYISLSIQECFCWSFFHVDIPDLDLMWSQQLVPAGVFKIVAFIPQC